MQSLQANDLVVVLNKWDTTTTPEGNDQLQNVIRIDNLSASEPDITITTHRNDSLSIINIPRSEKKFGKGFKYLFITQRNENWGFIYSYKCSNIFKTYR